MAASHLQQDPSAANAEPPDYSIFTRNEKRYIVSLVAMAGWFSTLSSFIYYPVIALVAKDLDTTISRINLTVTSYLAISGVSPATQEPVPMSLRLAGDMLGRRPLYVVTLTIYFLANMGIGLQHSFVALLLLRMLQSAGVSGRILQCFEGAQRLTVMQVLSLLHMELSPIYQRLQNEARMWLLYRLGTSSS